MRRWIMFGVLAMCVSGCSVDVQLVGSQRKVRVRPGPVQEQPAPMMAVAAAPWWTKISEWFLSFGDAFGLKEEAEESGKNVRKALETGGEYDGDFWAGLFRLKVRE